MLKNYEKYLEEISNKLLRNNINLGKQPDSNYEDIFYFSEQLSDVLWYMYIMKVVMAQEGEGYVYHDVYTLKSLVKEKANKEFLEEGRDLRKIQVPLMGIIGNSKLSSEPEEDDNDAWVNDSDDFIDDAVDFDEEVVDEDEEDDLGSSDWIDSSGSSESLEEKEETFVDDVDWDNDFSSEDDPDEEESDESEEEFFDDEDDGFVDEEDFDDEEESDSEEEFYDDADWGDSDEDSEDEFYDDEDDGFVDDEEDFDDSDVREDEFVDDIDWDDDFSQDDDADVDDNEEEEFVDDVDWGDSDDDEEDESEEEQSSGYSEKVEKKDAFKNVKRENDLMNDIMTKTNKASSMLKKAGKEFGKSLIQK